MSKSTCRSISVCEKCYSSFVLSEDELVVPMGMKFRKDIFIRTGINVSFKENLLKTWRDWVEHVQNHCPSCRLSSPPQSCLDDLERIKKRG